MGAIYGHIYPSEGQYKGQLGCFVVCWQWRLGTGIVVQDFEGHLIAFRSPTKNANLKPVAADASF